MRALKFLVIAMGIAIIAGTAVLVTLIIERGNRLATGDAPPAAAMPATPEGKLALPAGARVLETRLEGGRIALRAALADGSEAVFIFDAESGNLLRRLDITRTP